MLIKPLRDAFDAAGKEPGPSFALSGLGAIDQARDYAREIVQAGVINKAPVELNCHQAMSDDMVQRAFRDAKKGILIIDEVDHLAREETFVSLAIQNITKKKCTVLICGTKPGLDKLFADNRELQARLQVIDTEDPAILKELDEQKRLKAAEKLKKMVSTQEPFQSLRKFKIIPKGEN